jgi:glycolate oxidase iron-sulfur subunit
VAYHDACHLGHGQRVREQPRAVLRSIPELEVVDIPEAAICCGSAGIYNMVMPHPASELGNRKAANIRSVEPDIVVTANPGCLLQIGKHLAAPAMDGSVADGRAQEGTRPDRATATARLAGPRGTRRSRRGASPDGSVLPLLHPVQLLDASIRGVPVPRT